MAFDAVPWIIDGTEIDAEEIRRAMGTLLETDGIVTAGDLALSQTTTPSMSVQMAAGQIWVKGSSSSAQGPYYTRNGAPVTLTHNAADGSLPRIDTWVVEVVDPEYVGGSSKVMQPVILPGTPTSGALYPSNTTGVAAVPASAKVIGYVNVAAGATSISNANIFTVVSTFTLNSNGVELQANKGQPNGYAGLNSSGIVPASELAAYTVAQPSRAFGTAYQPNTSRATLVIAIASAPGTASTVNIKIGPTSTPSTDLGTVGIGSGGTVIVYPTMTFIVPPGWYYELSVIAGSPTLASLTEITL